MLKVLDNIQNVENVDLRLLAETFLTHSLLRDDIVRILNPILLKLLSPSTVRISIQNINIQDTDFQINLEQPDSQKIDDAQARKVYAVSNVNGNVMYHVTDDPDPKPLKKKWYMFNRNNKKLSQVVNTTSSLTDSSSVVTKKSKDFKNYDLQMNVERNGKNQVKMLFVYLCTTLIYIYVVCSKSIANFEFSHVTYIRFSIFCGDMLVLIFLIYADKFDHFECSVNF